MPPEIAIETRFFPFFYHLVREFLEIATERVSSFDAQEIAYFLKGVTNLHYIVKADKDLSNQEEAFRTALLEHLNTDHTKVSRFDPYTVSKALRYLLAYNEGGAEA